MPTSSTGVDEVHKARDKEKKFLVMKETVEKCQQLVKKTDTDEIDEMSTDEIKAKMIELTNQTKFNLAMLEYCEQGFGFLQRVPLRASIGVLVSAVDDISLAFSRRRAIP